MACSAELLLCGLMATAVAIDSSVVNSDRYWTQRQRLKNPEQYWTQRQRLMNPDEYWRQKRRPINPDGYWTQRRRLMEQDRFLSLGGNTILDTDEQRLSDRLQLLKDREYNSSWFSPAQHFTNVRHQIRASDLFSIIQHMPKGAILHVHDLSALSVDKTIENITYMQNLYLCNDTKSGGGTNVRLSFFSSPDSSCRWQLLSDVRARVGRKAVDVWLRSKLSMVDQLPFDVYPALKSVWSRFAGIMEMMLGLLSYDLAWRRYIELAVHQMAADNIYYMEIRTTLPQLKNLNGALYPATYTAEIYQQTFQRYKNNGILPFGGKIIYAPLRKVTSRQVSEDVDEALMLQQRFPDLLAGFDLVGQEDLGRPLKAFIPQLLRLIDNRLPTFYHAGETYWLGTSVDENLYDAVLLNATRIGHGYGIVKHPRLVQEIIKRNIAIELCPISNQMLGLVSDLRNHPAASLLASSVPLVVSSDDPGSWGAEALSYDVYVTYMTLAGRRADLRLLRQLFINSIKYSSLTDSEKDDFLEFWYGRWQDFLKTAT